MRKIQYRKYVSLCWVGLAKYEIKTIIWISWLSLPQPKLFLKDYRLHEGNPFINDRWNHLQSIHSSETFPHCIITDNKRSIFRLNKRSLHFIDMVNHMILNRALATDLEGLHLCVLGCFHGATKVCMISVSLSSIWLQLSLLIF